MKKQCTYNINTHTVNLIYTHYTPCIHIRPELHTHTYYIRTNRKYITQKPHIFLTKRGRKWDFINISLDVRKVCCIKLVQRLLDAVLNRWVQHRLQTYTLETRSKGGQQKRVHNLVVLIYTHNAYNIHTDTDAYVHASHTYTWTHTHLHPFILSTCHTMDFTGNQWLQARRNRQCCRSESLMK